MGLDCLSPGDKEAPASLSAVFRGNALEINDSARLVSLMEGYAGVGMDRMLNQAVSEDILDSFAKTGLQVALAYPQGKDLSVSGCVEKAKVERVYVLDDGRRWVVVCLKGAKIVSRLSETEISEINKCICKV